MNFISHTQNELRNLNITDGSEYFIEYLNKDMTKHKIKRISKYFLSNELDKLEIRRNLIYHINFQR